MTARTTSGAAGRSPDTRGRGATRPKPLRTTRRTLSFDERATMARLVGVDLPRDKRIEVALTYIYGIGLTRAQQVLKATGGNPDLRVHQLGDEELVKLRDAIEANFKIEGDLRREVQADIRRKIEIGSYQGRRHRQGLPVRGQRTKTNARTRKGPKRTVAGKKKAK